MSNNLIAAVATFLSGMLTLHNLLKALEFREKLRAMAFIVLTVSCFFMAGANFAAWHLLEHK